MGRPFTIVVCFEDDTRSRFVMVRHRDRGWELPGGRIEEDEDALAAAQREFAEETGHRLERARIILVQHRKPGLCHVVTGRWGRAIDDSVGDEAVVEHRFVGSVDEVAPLAFPDDPYDEMGRALGTRLR